MKDRRHLYQLIGANKAKTAVFIVVISVFLGAIGYVVINTFHWGIAGYVLFGIFIVVYNFIMYFTSDKLALAATGSVPADPDEFKTLHNIVEEVSIAAGTPKPRVYITPSPSPNAFATGRNPQHAAVAVTEGILRILDDEELEGVLAHELAHVKNRDVLISTIAATLAGAITYLAHMAQWAAMFGGRSSDDEEGGGNPLALILMAILAPIAAMLVQLAVSRAREFQADATGARVAGKPWGLAKALEKLQMANEAVPMVANPSTAHLFIVNPLSGDTLMRLFSTHPPIEERIARLRAMRA